MLSLPHHDECLYIKCFCNVQGRHADVKDGGTSLYRFKGVTPIVDITTTTGYEWSTAQTQSTTTTTTDTTTTTQT